jgi:hypothetical protein
MRSVGEHAFAQLSPRFANRDRRHDPVEPTIEIIKILPEGCVLQHLSPSSGGDGAQSLGAKIESLHLLSFVVTGNVIAEFGNVPCVVGKSMAISRDALRAIGGFEAFTNVLAEDQAIGLAVHEAGYRIALSPLVVRTVVVGRTLRSEIDPKIGWNKPGKIKGILKSFCVCTCP